jgi:hypothetical protein
MTHFPHRLSRTGASAPAATLSAKGGPRDVLWGRPVFKAPQLQVRPPQEPLPFTPARITRRPRSRAATVA